ncbi:MAG: hypothetical protein WD844_16260 [Thermoleophilaceae bacterium]
MTEHGHQVAVVVGTTPPVVAVLHDDPPGGSDLPHDSGYAVLMSDAPDHGDDATDDDYYTWCLHCLIEHHPQVGAGLDLARHHGSVMRDPDTGDWHPEQETEA